MSVARIATRQRQGGGGGEQRLGGGSFEGKCVQRTRWEGERRRRAREKRRTRDRRSSCGIYERPVIPPVINSCCTPS